MKRLVLLCLLASAAPAAWGQYFETWFTGGESLMAAGGLGSLTPIAGNKDDVELTNGHRFGFRVAFNGDRLIGHELFYTYNQTHIRYNQLTPVVEIANHNLRRAGAIGVAEAESDRRSETILCDLFCDGERCSRTGECDGCEAGRVECRE